METKVTCLHDRHIALGAKMSPFAGYDMPIEYAGLDDEHFAVRSNVGVFDVSHMGEIDIIGNDATDFVNHIFTGNVAPMSDGDCMYGMMCRPNGGTVDDLLVYKYNANKYLLVVNASNAKKDIAWIRENVGSFAVEILDRCADYGQLALQGPNAEKVMLEVLNIDGSDLKFYTFKTIDTDGDIPMIVSRTGYTGEDGFELYASEKKIVELWDKLISSGVAPCGLGCRDTLRFEAGLPLYGDELEEDITPIEAGLSMFVKLDKPNGFIGSEVLAKQKADKPARRLVGLEINSPAAARHGFEVLSPEGNTIGHVTTGYVSPTLGKNIAMAFVETPYAQLGTELMVKIRRKTAPATVVKKRFYTPNYKNH